MYTKNTLTIFLAALVVLAPLAGPLALAKVSPLAATVQVVGESTPTVPELPADFGLPPEGDHQRETAGPTAACPTELENACSRVRIEFVSPTPPTYFAPATSQSFAWSSPVNDEPLGVDLVYAVDVLDASGDIQSTTEVYRCNTASPGVNSCQADVVAPESEGTFTARLRVVSAPEAESVSILTCAEPGSCDTVDFIVDATAPVLGFGVDDAPVSSNWYTLPPVINLFCADAGAGCDDSSLKYGAAKENPKPLTTYEATGFTLSDGTHQLVGRGYDLVGKRGDVTDTIRIDTVLPTIAATMGATPKNPDGTYSGPVTVTFTCYDATSNCASVTVDGATTPGVSHQIEYSADGAYTLPFSSLDGAGLTSLEMLLEFQIDTKAPTVTPTLAPADPDGTTGWYRSAVNVALACETNDCKTITYSVNDGPTVIYANPFFLQDGEDVKLDYDAVDAAENMFSGATIQLNQDTVAPTVTLGVTEADGGNGYHVTAPTLSPGCSDTTSGCQGDPQTVYVRNGAQVLGFGEDGDYSLYATASDVAGNHASSTVRTVKLDQTPPTLTISTTEPGPASGWFTTAPTIEITCLDGDGSGCSTATYKIGSGSTTVYSGPFSLPSDGDFTITVTANDAAGHGTSATLLVKQDTVAPAITLSPTATQPPIGGWYPVAVDVAAVCSDATSGCEVLALSINDNPESATTATLGATGTFVARATGSDAAGNAASAIDLTLKVDLSEPAVSGSCIFADGVCTPAEEDNDPVATTTTVNFRFASSDVGSGVASKLVEVLDANSAVLATQTATSDSASFDLSTYLSEPIEGVFTSDDFTFRVTVTDGVGHTATESFVFDVNTAAADPAILLKLTNNPNTFVPSGTNVTLVYEAKWVGGENVGEPVQGATIRIMSDNGLNLSATTDLSGLATFMVTQSEIAHVIQATAEVEDITDVRAPAALKIVWTGIAVERLGSQDMPRTTLYANPGETYKLAYKVTATHNGSGLSGARVVLTDGTRTFNALTNASGFIRVPTMSSAPLRTTFGVTAVFNPALGPAQEATTDDVTVTWAKLELTNLAVSEPGTIAGWHNVSDTVLFDLRADLVFGGEPADREPATGTQLTFTALGDQTTGNVGELGDVQFSLTYAAPQTAMPVLALVSTPEGVTTNNLATAQFLTQYWARLVVDQVSVQQDAVDVNGWHNVTDAIDFSFRVGLDVGAEDLVPAVGAELSFIAVDETPVTVGANGLESVTRTFADATVVTPSIVLVGTPQGVTAQNIAEYGEQIWTEIALVPSMSDAFVNLSSASTVAFDVTYAHGATPPVGNATIDVVLADMSVLATCWLDSACVLSMDAAYDDGLTLVVTDSEHGITRQSGGVNAATTNIVWTQIVFSACSQDDTVINPGDSVSLTCDAKYAHDNSNVPSGTLGFVGAAPESCSLTQSDIIAGVANVTLKCTETKNLVGDNAPTFTVTDAHEDVTRYIGDALIISAQAGNVVFRQLSQPDGWHNVSDTVEFAFTALFDFGGDVTEPADGAQVNLSFSAEDFVILTTDADGYASHNKTLIVVTDTLPTLSLVSTPELVNAFTPIDYGRQRWTEIILVPTVDDALVNATSTTGLGLVATYAHDESQDDAVDYVESASIGVQATALGFIDTCEIVAGLGSCDIVVDETYANGLTFTVNVSAHDIGRQFSDIAASAAPAWTEIVVTGCTVDDGLVNKNDAVTLTCGAAFAHNSSAVPFANLTIDAANLAAEAQGLCTVAEPAEGASHVMDGVLSLVVSCNVVYGGLAVPLVVSDGYEDVTRLSARLLSLNATWTQVIVEYTVREDRHFLEPEAPVVFDATLTYAHDGSAVDNGVVIVKSTTEGDLDEFVCLTGTGAAGSGVAGQCSLEVTKSLGNFTFEVTGASSVIDVGGHLALDVTSMENTPESVTYRWTSITFDQITCQVGEDVVTCDTHFAPKQVVKVTVRAVAADDAEVLDGAFIRLGGQDLTTDANGNASRSFTRFSPGNIVVTARGLSASLGGGVVTHTTPVSTELMFE